MPNLFYFTELAKTNPQLPVDAYGPVATDMTTKYETGANIQLSGVARAFAIQDSMMIVQPNVDDSDLVNIILRPIEGLSISTETIQYYVYRGIQKADFVTAGVVTNPGVTDFLTNYWANWANYVSETSYAGAVPTPREAFGYDEVAGLADDILIENIYNNSLTGTRAIKVSAGEWIGNFTDTQKINVEIITNSEHRQDIDPDHPDYLRMDLGFFRKSKNVIDVSDVDPGGLLSTSEKTFKIKVRREEILSFMDPAAFFGLHYYAGVWENYFDGSQWKDRKLRKQNLYNDLISKFETRNRVYIDIRSEYGYSLNFYDNYQLGVLDELLMLKSDSAPSFVPDKYYTNEWPIFFAASWVGTNPKNRIRIKLRVGEENKEPIAFLDNPKFRGIFNKRKFLLWDDLPADPSPDYAGDFQLKFPNVASGSPGANIAQYIRIQYFRKQDYDGAYPTKVISKPNTLSQVFGSLEMPSIDGLGAVFNHSKSQRLQFVKGSDFMFVAYPEAYRDATNTLFLTEIEYAGKKNEAKRPKKKFQGNTITESPVFPQEMAFQKTLIKEDDGTGMYNDIYVIQLVNYYNSKKKNARKDDVYALGITNVQHAELLTAAQNAGISNRHSVFIKILPFGHLPEQNGIKYGKHKLSVLGLNDEGVVTQATPATDIFVYTFDDRILASNEFATPAAIPIGYPDPALIKQWDHIGTWHYRVLNGTEPTIVDPNNNSSLPSPLKVNLNANVFYPTDYEGVTDPVNISSVETDYPLIVIVHGNGQFFESYDRIGKHLAHNGFIAASIDCTYITGEDPELKPTGGGMGSYDFYFEAPFSTDMYGYDSGAGKICLYDKVTDSFLATNELEWTTPGDFDVVTVGGKDYIQFSNSIKAYGGKYGAASLGRSAILFHHLEAIKNKFGSTVKNSIGLIGHSRGGEAILTAERLIGSQTVANLSGLNQIDALFSLAPTDQYWIERLSSVPYFVLYGSKDGDVKTGRLSYRKDPYDFDTVKNVVSSSGFALWDRSTNEQKSMAFMHGATHNGFVTLNVNDYNTSGVGLGKGKGRNAMDFVADEGIQRLALDAYANGFFRKTLKNESYWFDLISGKWTPPSIEHGSSKCHFQFKNVGGNSIEDFDSVSNDLDFSDGKAIGILRSEQMEPITDIASVATTDSSNRLIVPTGDFGSFNVGDYVSGAGISKFSKIIFKSSPDKVFLDKNAFATAASVTVSLSDNLLDLYSPHASKAVLLNAADFSTYEVYSGGGINASSYDFFAFRISKKYGIATDLTGLELILYNSSTPYRLATPVAVPDAYKRHDVEDRSKSAMVTLRFPLADFVGLDLTNITKIEVDFGTIVGNVELDDFEFTD